MWRHWGNKEPTADAVKRRFKTQLSKAVRDAGGSLARRSGKSIDNTFAVMFENCTKNEARRRGLSMFLFFVDAAIPFNATRNPSFRQWMKELKVRSVPRVAFLSVDLLDAVHLAVMDILRGTLSSTSSFSITFDMWSDVGHKNDYLAITR